MSAIVRASYPVSFQLLNRERQPILGIFDGQQGQTLKLEITNSSRRNMKPKQLTGSPTADNHHFELRFRPGTLVLPDSTSPSRPAISVEESGWKISDKPAVSDAGVSFYLLIINPTTIESGKSTTVTLKNLSGDGKVGGHGTRVELKWNNNLEYVASASGQSPEPLVPGHRLQHLSVVNESGQKHIPLHVGIVGNDKVLNNGTVNELKLRLTNLAKPDPLKPGEGNIELNPELGPSKPPASKFILSFDASIPPQVNAWALGSMSDVNKISIKAENKPFNTPTPSELGQSVQWIMWPTESISLRPGDYIDFKITPIKTTHPSGLTNLYIHYKNIPGYWDGNFVSLIEKAPLVYATNGVGIGTNDPKATLHVNGEARAETIEVKKQIKAERLFGSATGNDGTGIPTPADALHVVGDTLLGTRPTQIKCVSDDHRLIFKVDGFEIREKDEIVFSPGSSGAQTAKVVMKNDGRVGIGFLPNNGKLDPATHLHVAGSGDQEIMIQSTDEKGIKWTLQSSSGDSEGRFEIVDRSAGKNRFTILKNGNVGIGTITPAAPLHVFDGQANSFTLARWMDDVNIGANGGQRSDLRHSIIAEERIRAAAFDTVSDARVKNVLGTSGGASDLDALLKIIITDYTYKDVIGKGNGTYKKVIGQQVEKVFPQAVSRTTDVVPDIYQQASIRGGWISLATDLKKGERVKLITEKGEEDILEVLEVAPDKFRVDLEPEGEKIFVFGREVDDFRVVDYDAISMLNVSATQQLKKDMDHELKALRVENAELRAANDALAKRVQLLESKLEAVVGVMGAVSGSNGNGRH